MSEIALLSQPLRRLAPVALALVLACGMVHAQEISPPADRDALIEGVLDSLRDLESRPQSQAEVLRWLQEESARNTEALKALSSQLEEANRKVETLRATRDGIDNRLEALGTAEVLLDRLAVARAASATSSSLTRPALLAFNRDIRPLLSENCFKCHGPDAKQRKAGLRLDTEGGATASLKSGNAAVVPGDRTNSALYQRITTADADDRMPPADSHKTLTTEQIETLGKWIDEGAGYQTHWAFIPPEKSPLPEVSDVSWSAHPIDRFILAQIEEKGLVPSQQAAPETLLRRAYLDVIGIPPTPEEQKQFLADPSEEAYSTVVEELLASPHYGERWARHWLDAGRYADSNGYSIDGPREMWKYRDWVIQAYNQDLPFDRFVREQIAGDLLPDAAPEDRIATGFHRNTMINQEGGIDQEEFRIESIIDRVNTTGTVFLGLTIGCAQCHDHKYDPITQTEYYRLFAFYNNDKEPQMEVPTPEQTAERDRIDTETKQVKRDLADYLIAAESKEQVEWERTLTPEDIGHLGPLAKEAFSTRPTERTEDQRKRLSALFEQRDPRAREFHAKIAEIKKGLPDIPTTLVLAALDKPRLTQVFMAGDFTRKGDPVQPGVPASLNPLHIESATPTRLDLADWLVARENPLTARVVVNRVWQQYFGRGLVETDNDFGTQGSLPTHPELLDWLAVDLMENGWSLKHLHRLILTSSAYRQSSHRRPDLEEADPENLFLARQSRVRLDAEIIRDSALAVSGKLNSKIGGPSVYPPQPEGVMTVGQSSREWETSQGEDRYRRGLYTFLWRMTPYPSLTVFDAPNAMEACTRRVRSNTPLQSLTLLNDAAYYELAEALADRILAEGPEDLPGRLSLAFQLSLGRQPSETEVSRLRSLASESDPAPEGGRDERALWIRIARVLLNLDEFITRE